MPLPRTANANQALQALVTGRSTGPDPIVVGRSVRSSSDVVDGLGLSPQQRTALLARVAAWRRFDRRTLAATTMIDDLRAIFPDDPYRRREVMRRAMELIAMSKALPVFTIGRPPALELVTVEFAKALGHKYVKREPNKSPPPKYRYWYRVPGKGLVERGGTLKTGTKLRGVHAGKEGHYEVLNHDKDRGLIRVRHDESGKEAHFKEHDLHRMVTAYHKKRTAESRPQGKAPPGIPLERITMADLARGEYDNVEGFGDPSDLAVQAAQIGGDREFAIMKQPNGFCLVSRRKRTTGAARTVVGEAAEVKLRSAKGKGIDGLKAEYVLMEAGDMIASHRPEALGHFPVNPAYPEGVQERRYHAISAEQEKVDRIAKDLDPAIMINTNPDAVNGPPILDQNRAVLGGNGRAMAVQRAYREYPEVSSRLRAYLTANARKYGIAAADVRAMKEPMIVRRVNVKDPGSKNENLKLLGRRMNEALTQGLDPRSEEVAVAQFVTGHVTDALVSAIEPDQTLSEFLYSAASEDFVTSLRQAGVIDDYNKAQYLEKNGKRLNEDGRRRVERVLAARLIPDADLLERMHPTLRESLALSTPSIVKAEQAGWPIYDSLRLAVEADLHIRATSTDSTKVAEDNFLRQTEAAGTGVDLSNRVNADPLAKILLSVVRQHAGTTITPRGFRGFALRAMADREDYGFAEGKSGTAGTLLGFGRTRISPADALDIEFGVTPQRSKEKKERDVAAKEQRRAEKEAEKEIARMERLGGKNQRALFAASYRDPTLVKARGKNALMNRAIHLAHWLVDADVHRSTICGREPDVDKQRVVREVLADVAAAVASDPAMIEWKDSVTPGAVKNTVDAMVGMVQQDMGKSASFFSVMVEELHAILRPRVGSLLWDEVEIRKSLSKSLAEKMGADPDAALSLGRSGVTATTIDGLVKAMIEIYARKSST